MTKDDMIANERHQAALYRREAARRHGPGSPLAEKLLEWAEASDRRADYLRAGPLFGAPE